MPEFHCTKCRGTFWWMDDSKPLCNNCMQKNKEKELL